jgi:alkylation response protein AidB-like acyl-CoA dehydrogenase
MQRTLFEPAHEAYRARIREYLETEVVPRYPQWVEDRIVPRNLYTGLGALGAFGHGVPTEYGGSGVDDFRYNMILTEESARLGVFPAMVGPGLVAEIITPYLLGLGNEEQKARWLPGVVTGETVLAIAMTEPGTGSDLAGIATTAVRDGDDWIVNGTKKFIGNGMNAGLIVVAARTGPDRHRGLSLLVVESDMPGFERVRNIDKVGMHAHNTTELRFTDVRVPDANMLGAEGEGFLGLTRNLAQERVTVAVHAVANALAALELTVAYVRERQAFGKAIGQQQTVRFSVAEMATEIDIAQTYVDRCVTALNEGDLTPVDAAKAKWWTTELLWRVVDTGVQLHGGNGYLPEYPIAQLWLDSRAERIYAGTNEIMKDLIGRSMQLG